MGTRKASQNLFRDILNEGGQSHSSDDAAYRCSSGREDGMLAVHRESSRSRQQKKLPENTYKFVPGSDASRLTSEGHDYQPH